jgi:hypothetical protein
LLFLEKTVDLISYKKLISDKDKSKHITMLYLSSIGSLAVSCLVIPFIELYFAVVNYDLFLIIFYVGVLLYAEWLVVKFFLAERKAVQNKSVTNRSLVTNLVLTGVYRVIYSCYFLWFIEMSWNSGEEITGNGHYEADFKWTILYWVIYILPIVVFTLIKAVTQYFICQKWSKSKLMDK